MGGVLHLEVFKGKPKRNPRKGRKPIPQYYWRKVGVNGRVIAVSGEGFNRRRYAAFAAANFGSCPDCGNKLPITHDNDAHLVRPGKKVVKEVGK